jgi:hypothetical protein
LFSCSNNISNIKCEKLDSLGIKYCYLDNFVKVNFNNEKYDGNGVMLANYILKNDTISNIGFSIEQFFIKEHEVNTKGVIRKSLTILNQLNTNTKIISLDSCYNNSWVRYDIRYTYSTATYDCYYKDIIFITKEDFLKFKYSYRCKKGEALDKYKDFYLDVYILR